jgi:cytochrome c oxidase subunit 1
MLGLDGMIRRISDYSGNAGWTELNFLSTVGAFLIAFSVLPFLWNVFITLRKPMEHEADPWDANSLEWATTSPPPPWNFDGLPEVHSERPWFDQKYPGVGHGPTPEHKPETEGAAS